MLVLLFVFWQGKPALWRIPFGAFSLFPLNHVVRRLYDAVGGVNAEACLHCGHCESRCPFSVKQESRMDEIAKYFKGGSYGIAR